MVPSVSPATVMENVTSTPSRVFDVRNRASTHSSVTHCDRSSLPHSDGFSRQLSLEPLTVRGVHSFKFMRVVQNGLRRYHFDKDI
ncbi:hypothetical protein CDAR_410911 [Caerostris darwini]|uniref:Uncharacterized protein n=1 Tax=Caerostris darwini TaxID=1538125 RepID=A0AAV4SGQ9_9ARAC|nr:hypothetical protein CDAR_410911 [Caerostris darwini]